MKTIFQKPDTMPARYERKFHLAADEAEAAKWRLKLNPALLREIYYGRYINNIYFDTPQWDIYEDHVYGRPSRFKVRVRWYGMDVGREAQPHLEIKARQGACNYKFRYPLGDFDIKRCSDKGMWRECFMHADIPGPVKEYLFILQPALQNRYWRQYFLSADRQLRLTLDTRLAFRRVGQGEGMLHPQPGACLGRILEIKYGQDAHDAASRLCQSLPYRMSRFSKYIIGVNQVFQWADV